MGVRPSLCAPKWSPSSSSSSPAWIDPTFGVFDCLVHLNWRRVWLSLSLSLSLPLVALSFPHVRPSLFPSASLRLIINLCLIGTIGVSKHIEQANLLTLRMFEESNTHTCQLCVSRCSWPATKLEIFILNTTNQSITHFLFLLRPLNLSSPSLIFINLRQSLLEHTHFTCVLLAPSSLLNFPTFLSFRRKIIE